MQCILTQQQTKKSETLNLSVYTQPGQYGYEHYAEPRHSTEAITDESITVMRQHWHNHSRDDTPLFLYIAFNAAHAPLQPLPRHAVPSLSLSARRGT
jgi:hypothetical protein